eukprot:272912_1
MQANEVATEGNNEENTNNDEAFPCQGPATQPNDNKMESTNNELKSIPAETNDNDNNKANDHVTKEPKSFPAETKDEPNSIPAATNDKPSSFPAEIKDSVSDYLIITKYGTKSQLEDLLAKFGTFTQLSIQNNIALVKFDKISDAVQVKSTLNGYHYHGHHLIVNYAKDPDDDHRAREFMNKDNPYWVCTPKKINKRSLYRRVFRDKLIRKSAIKELPSKRNKRASQQMKPKSFSCKYPTNDSHYDSDEPPRKKTKQ